MVKRHLESADFACDGAILNTQVMAGGEAKLCIVGLFQHLTKSWPAAKPNMHSRSVFLYSFV